MGVVIKNVYKIPGEVDLRSESLMPPPTHAPHAPARILLTWPFSQGAFKQNQVLAPFLAVLAGA
jgi:hypothetical protein